MFSGLFKPFLSMIKSKKKIPVFECKRNGGKSINKIHLVCIWKKNVQYKWLFSYTLKTLYKIYFFGFANPKFNIF